MLLIFHLLRDILEYQCTVHTAHAFQKYGRGTPPNQQDSLRISDQEIIKGPDFCLLPCISPTAY